MSNNIAKRIIKIPANVKVTLIEYAHYNSIIIEGVLDKKLINYPKDIKTCITGDELKLVFHVSGPVRNQERVIRPSPLYPYRRTKMIPQVGNTHVLPIWGTINSIILSLFTAVTVGFTIPLYFNGVGYSFQVVSIPSTDPLAKFPNRQDVILNFGSSAPVRISAPDNVQIKLINNTTISGFSTSYSLLTNFLNKVRLVLPASKDPYKGKGLHL